MRLRNGLTKWLLGIVTTVALGWAYWVSAGVVQAKVDRVTLDAIASDVREIKDAVRRKR